MFNNKRNVMALRSKHMKKVYPRKDAMVELISFMKKNTEELNSVASGLLEKMQTINVSEKKSDELITLVLTSKEFKEYCEWVSLFVIDSNK